MNIEAKHTASFPQRRQRGSVLFDAIMGMLVIFGLVAGVMVMNSQARGGSDLNATIQNAASISSEIRAQYAKRTNYTGLSKTAVMAASSLPDTAFNDVAIAAGTVVTTFTLAFSNLPAKVCTRLGNADDNTDFGPKSASACSGTTLTVTYTR